MNERIRVPQVRVISDDGEQAGVLPVREALALAQSRGLDLVEVSPTARPPVCRIMDYGKFKYEQNRRARKARKKQHVMHLKEIKMRPKIDEHDYGFKMDHARQFLSARDKVKFTITFRGREMAHPEHGHKLIQRVIAELADAELASDPSHRHGLEPFLVHDLEGGLDDPLPRERLPTPNLAAGVRGRGAHRVHPPSMFVRETPGQPGDDSAVPGVDTLHRTPILRTS